MKVLLTVAYVIVLIVLSFLSVRTDKWSKDGVLNGEINSVKINIGYILISLLMYSLFAVLTLKFYVVPVFLVIIISGLISVSFVAILESIIGLKSIVKKNRIAKLMLFMHFIEMYSSPLKRKIFLILGLILFLLWLAGLFVFWINPIHDTQAMLLIALFTFIIPLFLSYLIQIFLNLPLITSGNVDDDLRNYYLLIGMPAALMTSVWLVLPLYALKELRDLLASNYFNSQWPYLIAPIITFLLLNIVPYFIGVYNFKNNRIYYLRRRRDLLTNLNIHIILPPIGVREELLNEDVREIKNEIELCSSNDKVFKVLEDVQNIDEASKANMALKDPQGWKPTEVILNNIHLYRKWNFKVNHVDKLSELLKVINHSTDINIADYLKKSIEQLNIEIRETKTLKNYLFGVIVSSFVALISFGAKFFESDISKLFKSGVDMFKSL